MPAISNMTNTIKAPFPWLGGKSRIAAEVWSRFGDVPNYVDPFAGSGTTAATANLLGRNAIAIELQPNYAPLIQERLSSITCPLPGIFDNPEMLS